MLCSKQIVKCARPETVVKKEDMENIREFCTRTSIHGVGYLVRKSTVKRDSCKIESLIEIGSKEIERLLSIQFLKKQTVQDPLYEGK